MHPADELRGVKNTKLSQKRIILGITGSIAAVESIRLTRELIRLGADVVPVMTKAATKIIHPDALEFASGHRPIIELTGKAEHVFYCGLVKDKADLLLISPCTANTLSKIALGIDDTAVTTCATTALGSGIPIMVVPAMHLSMYNHRIFQSNIKKCKQVGVLVVDPVISGSKARMVGTDTLVALITRVIGRQDLVGKKVLIIGGATAEKIDQIRILTNRSSGKTAVSLAVEAFERGAQVDLWYGYAQEQVPSFIACTRFETITDLVSLIKKKPVQHYDSIIVCAALANYVPKEHQGKIPSGQPNLVITCSSAPVVLDMLKKQAAHAKIFAFKAEEKKSNLVSRAKQLLEKHDISGVVANTLEAFGTNNAEIVLIQKKKKNIWLKGTKDELASAILDMIT